MQVYSITVIYSALSDGDIFQKWQILWWAGTHKKIDLFHNGDQI